MKIVYLALGLWLLPGMLWAQSAEKENEFTMSMQIRPRAEYRNGAQFPRSRETSSCIHQQPCTPFHGVQTLGLEHEDFRPACRGVGTRPADRY